MGCHAARVTNLGPTVISDHWHVSDDLELLMSQCNTFTSWPPLHDTPASLRSKSAPTADILTLYTMATTATNPAHRRPLKKADLALFLKPLKPTVYSEALPGLSLIHI